MRKMLLLDTKTKRNADEEEADDDSWCQYDTNEDELY